MDPALIDRTTKAVLGVPEGSQPVRTMTIPGIENSIPARILSTNMRGAGTRIAQLRPGWGSRLAGSFTADVELFVLKGEVSVGQTRLSDYEYISIGAGGVVGGFGSETGAVVLLMTAGPVRYDTSKGGAPARTSVGRPAESEWERHDDGLFTRSLVAGDHATAWLGSTRQDTETPLWHSHTADQETLVLDGEVEYLDLVGDEIVTTHGAHGTYFYRPGGAAHAGPMVRGEETVLTFNHSLGPLETTVLEPPGVEAI